jgi:ribonuclease BN (tRNA processing enzyme)
VVSFARKAEVGRLVLFHHDPYHPDHELEDLVAEAQRLWGPDGPPVVAAWEGMTIEMAGDGVSCATLGAGAER